MEPHHYIASANGKCHRCNLPPQMHVMNPRLSTIKTWHQVYMEAREKLIKRAAPSVDDITPGLYLLLSKDELSEIEPRNLVIYNPYVQKQQLKHFDHFYFVKL